MDPTIVRAAPAKLNLDLRVVGRRADGYHLLDSLVAFCDVADRVAVEPASDLRLTIDGPFAAALAGTDPADNLVSRAARALAGRAGVSPRAAIHLTKNLPVASGIGGGSADAAATLLALVDLWRVALPQEELFDIAATLGADLPMCLAGRAMRVSGVGEILAAVAPLPRCGVLLVNPGPPLPTPAVFADFAASRGGEAYSAASTIEDRFDDCAVLGRAIAARGNDLTAAARRLAPAIGDVLDALAATEYARVAAMSGSGATCFALYDDFATAERARADLAARHPAWWCAAGRLL